MKNIIKPIIALFALFVVSCSVEDIQDRPVIEAGDAPVLTAPTDGATYVLLPENAEKQVERFTWKSSNYGGAVEVTYAVQVDLKDAKFAKAKTIGSAVSQNQVSVTQAVLNTAALALGATPFSPVQMEVRVQSTLGTTSPLLSNVIAIVVTPYTTEAPKLYVPGSYAEASGYPKNWEPKDSPQLATSGYGKVDFEGYIYFKNANDKFKFTDKPSWGKPGEYGAGATANTLSGEGSDIEIPAAGYYRIEADTEKLTYKATLASWSVTGSGTLLGWPSGPDGTAGQDYDMTYDPTTKVWSVTLDLTAAEIKFRANDAWNLNLGDDGANGSLEYGGANLTVPSAGNYTITLDLSSPRNYKYSITKN